MTGSALLVLVMLVGIGTWAFRYVPVRLALRRRAVGGTAVTLGERRGAGSGAAGAPAWLGRFLAGMGVAAVATLAGSALLPYLTRAFTAADVGAALGSVVPLLAGVAGTVLAFVPRRSVAAATLVGSACYAVAWWLLGASGPTL